MAAKSSRDVAAALTHIDARGEARMVDVSEKPATGRVATAEGRVVMDKATLKLIVDATTTRLDVTEGKVRLTRPDKKSVEVAAGHDTAACA